MLQGIEVRDPSEWQAQLERALNYASKLTLPNRPDVVILGKPTPSLQILTLSETKKTSDIQQINRCSIKVSAIGLRPRHSRCRPYRG